MERRTVYENTPGESHYQSLIAEPMVVDGKPGVLIDIGTMEKRVQYYLAMDEVTRLAGWLENRAREPFIPADQTMRKFRMAINRVIP